MFCYIFDATTPMTIQWFDTAPIIECADALFVGVWWFHIPHQYSAFGIPHVFWSRRHDQQGMRCRTQIVLADGVYSSCTESMCAFVLHHNQQACAARLRQSWLIACIYCVCLSQHYWFKRFTGLVGDRHTQLYVLSQVTVVWALLSEGRYL